MDGESSCGVLREASYYKMDKLLLEMRQAKTGIQMKQQKSFFNTVSNACTGRELVSWIQKRLSIRDEIEAIHFSNMLCYLGYIIPISERQINVKNDTSCYRIQRPALWPSRKWDTASKEYVIYLMKKQIKGKSLESFEQTALQKLELMFADSWSKLNKTAKDSVDKYYIGSKGDRDIEDSQERVFWRVHRPPPGHKTHHYRSDGFNKKSICMESINQQRKVELLQTKIKFMKLYLSRSESHPEQHSEKTLVTMTNHVIQRHKHDTLLVRNDIENPWVVIDEYFYEDLLEVEDESRTKLDLESWALDFKNLLRDVYGKELFAQFLHHEYSSENLTFWDACEELKQCTQSQLNGALEKIKRNFLMPGSRHEVNLDREIVQQTLQQLETTPTRYSLDLAQQQIFSLMKRDCYPRFLKSDVYRQLFLEFIEKKSRSITKEKKTSYIKKLYQLTKGSSMSPLQKTMKRTSESRRSSSPRVNRADRFQSNQDLSHQDNHHMSISPYYTRKGSNFLEVETGMGTLEGVRKAGSLSSLVVGSPEKEDEDKVSYDSGISMIKCVMCKRRPSTNSSQTLKRLNSLK